MFKAISTVSKVIFGVTTVLGGLTVASAIKDKKTQKPTEAPAEDTELKDIENPDAE